MKAIYNKRKLKYVSWPRYPPSGDQGLVTLKHTSYV